MIWYSVHTESKTRLIQKISILESYMNLRSYYLWQEWMKERKTVLGRRRKITLHSFRRFVKTVISDQVGQDYSEWFLGHAKSPYYIRD